MIYDAARHQVILFGGFDGRYLHDTWAWTGSTWTQLHPAASAGPRAYGSMTYDQARHRLVQFGGSMDARAVWNWNGTTWQLAQRCGAG